MKTAKWDKPLSKSAYDKIISKALTGVKIAGREDDFEEFVQTIDTYIENGKVILPWYDRHDIYDIIFHMIKDDIDTAMRRSREARERAAARRRAKEEMQTAGETQTDGEATLPADHTVAESCATVPAEAVTHPERATPVKPAKARRHKGKRYDEPYRR